MVGVVRTTVPPERAQRCLRGSGKNHSAARAGLGVNLVGVVGTTVLPEQA